MAASGEKADILTSALVVQAPRSRKSKWTILGLVALLASVIAVAFLRDDSLNAKLLSAISLSHGVSKLCPQSDALYPESHAQLWDSLGRVFDEDAFMTRAVQWLGGAVRIPYVSINAFCCAVFLLRLPWPEHSTESYDTMGPVGEDERWKVFGPFYDYLVQSFPLAFVISTPCDCNRKGVNANFLLVTRALH